MITETISRVALQPFVAEPATFYPIDVAASLAGMPRHRILVCCKRQMVTPWIDRNSGRYLFDIDAIRILRRIEYLHVDCGVNFTGIHIILSLVDELERARSRHRSGGGGQ